MNFVETLHKSLDHPEAFWLAITDLGSDFGFIALLSLYLWLVNPRGARQVGVFFGASVVLTDALKYAFDEPRPFFTDPNVASPAARATAAGPGLPSGHALVSATVWGLAAAQLRSRAFWWVAGIVVLLIALSRVVLGVHFLTDVLAGLVLGALLVLIGSRVTLPRRDFIVPLVAVVIAAFLPALATGLGILAGFWLSRPDFDAPRTWLNRLVFVALGFVVVFAVYFAFRVIPENLRHTGLVSALRYVALVLTATDLVPWLLRRLTPGGARTATA